MFLIDFIVIIVFIVVLSRQSGRISRLEAQLNTQAAPVAPTKTPVAAAVASVASTAQSVTPNIPPSAPKAVPAAPYKETHAAAIKEEVSSGRILAGIGIAAVFIGVAFFLKYAFDNNWIGPVGRIMMGIAAGVVLLGVGQVLRKKYLEFSDFLMGGGFGLLYLCLFFAHSFYQFISPLTAWFLMAVVTAVAFIMSIVNATQVLAFIAIIGGFLSPLLSSIGRDEMMILFGYMTLLNIAVLAISFYKKWPGLILAALVGTAIDYWIWLAGNYNESLLAPSLTFAVFTFAIFLAASIARSVKAKENADTLDYMALSCGGLFIAITGYVLIAPQHENLLGAGAVLIAAIYLVAAFIVNTANKADRALNILLPGIAVTFLSVAVPLQFDGDAIAVAWLVESIVLYAVATVAGNRGFQVMGAVTYVLGLMALFFTTADTWGRTVETPIFNGDFGIFALAIVAAFIIAHLYYKYGSVTPEVQKNGVTAFVSIGSILAILAVPHEFSGVWVALGWFIEAAIFYMAAVQALNRNIQIAGLVAYCLALFDYFFIYANYNAGQNFVPIFNADFLVLVFAVLLAYGIGFIYRHYGSVSLEVQKRGIGAFVVIANILTIYAVSSQIIFFYDLQNTESADNYSNMLVSIFWALYAAALTAIGFAKRGKEVRRLGLILFIITAFKVVVDVWDLGQIYRIVSFIAFGVIALGASFAYAKYKDRLKDVI